MPFDAIREGAQVGIGFGYVLVFPARHIDKGQWLGDCRAGNLHEGEGYLDIHSRLIWKIMPFASN